MDRKWLVGIAIFVVLLGIAAYFSVERLFPKTGSSSISASPTPGDQREYAYVPQKSEEIAVLVSAESPDYQLVPVTLSNEAALKKQLNSWNFWGENKVAGFNEKGARLDSTTAKALNVIVLEQSTFQQPFKVGDSGYFRIEIDYETGVVTVIVFLGNDAFANLDAATLAKRISDITLTAGYLMTHPESGVVAQSSQTPFVAVSK